MLENITRPKVSKNLSGLIFSYCMLISVPAIAIDEAIENALKLGDESQYGQLKFDLRYRYQNVHVDSNLPTKTANANTLRLRLGYLTPELYHFQSYIEYEGNLAMQEDYNSTRNGYTGFEVVADPEAQELNQFWLSFAGITDTVIKGGRQKINLDNQRFVGDNHWQQMEQTFDSLLISNHSIKNLTLNFAYIGGVLSTTSSYRNLQMPLLNFTYKFGKFSTLTGYAYWLADYDQSTNSSQTYGVRLHGAPKLKNDISLFYDVAYSNQSNYQNNPGSFQLDRYNILLGIAYSGVTLKSGMEILDGNGTYAFQTPLASGHGYQGWADQFLVTPATGVRDIQATIDKNFYGVDFLFAYHSFADSHGHSYYGDEYDFLISKNFGEHYQVLAKYAYYDADNSLAAQAAGIDKNTQKIWLQGSVSF
ncbi:MAG: alginate export family protein [Methyloprofundus sp.]|nr:alginate export family protein [Methyloprofundus sp.]MDT8424727.1 alginate export family protein [Methyloprofundus sp.]